MGRTFIQRYNSLCNRKQRSTNNAHMGNTLVTMSPISHDIDAGGSDMRALGCIFGTIVLLFAQFGFIVYGIFAGVAIFVSYILKQWSRGARLQAILLYGVLSTLIALVWYMADRLVMECSHILGAPHDHRVGLIFLSSLLALSFIGIAHYHQHKASKEE